MSSRKAPARGVSVHATYATHEGAPMSWFVVDDQTFQNRKVQARQRLDLAGDAAAA
ncbi:hypothetical protein [Actinomyces gaoshouyii]|uniref:hypothetical protein n=1 Tax=Actinomyces gaoshouyii TaxID=1960083 RepID=UPI0013DE3324|nr:hypothetical protein [Actinomyces gaoshouyii]